jgi:hypothetical protein
MQTSRLLRSFLATRAKSRQIVAPRTPNATLAESNTISDKNYLIEYVLALLCRQG